MMVNVVTTAQLSNEAFEIIKPEDGFNDRFNNRRGGAWGRGRDSDRDRESFQAPDCPHSPFRRLQLLVRVSPHTLFYSCTHPA